jgi:pyruvate/2-oxoglutarate dehydrogenase complex dihydrolipoamide dehydrogenase (E3) component/uncharacterized membrane protein YdjX (TVP38/TMEM64 family)
MNIKKLALLILVVAVIAAFFAFDLERFFTLAQIKARQAEILALFQAHPFEVAGLYFLIYVAVTAVSVPGAATLLTVLAGAVFGLAWGTVIVSFASSAGATLAFIASRFLFRDLVKSKFGDKLAAIDHGVEQEGWLYLFTLRLVPVVPFFLVNLMMGLTPMKTRTFYWASQAGMLAGTIAYVNVGTQLSRVDSLSGVLSPVLIGSFVVLGFLPLIAKKIIDAIRARRVYSRWARPARFERNLVVIGAGSAGLVASYIAAAVKAKVTLIERHKMGGDCLNTGCVPSKALIRSAKLLHQARNSDKYGIRSMTADYDFAEVMQRVHRVIRTIEPHDSVERYTGLGVECLKGVARIKSPWEVEVQLQDEHGAAAGTRVLTTRNIVIAAGATPLVPPIPGIRDVGFRTSDDLWGLTACPKRLLILGGGPIGCELAQAFSRLGSRVTQVEMMPRLLAREDPEASQAIAGAFAAESIDVRLEHRALRFEFVAGQKTLVADHHGNEVRIEFDEMICALGRAANVSGYGLEDLQIPVSKSHTVEVNEFLQTNYPNIFACGDVAGPYQFTHTAAHMAWYASVNALFGRFKKFRVDYSVIPWCTFTDPEVARVGLSEAEAKAKSIAFEVSRYDIEELDRAVTDETARGFVKVLTVPGNDKILGATIVGEHAGDLISEFVAAMKHGYGLNKILGTIHVYPTMTEANKYVAGQWKRAHAPKRLLGWVERFHQWQLG